MEYLWAFIRSLLAIVALLGAFAYMTWVERRLLARFQIRVGPSRVGIMGLLQPIADAVKMVFKEQITVHNADRLVYVIAPIVSVTFALLTFGIIPFGPKGSFFGLNPWVLNLDIGVLYILAIGELAVYGIFLAGWASGSKYSLMGSMRSAAGLISYDLALGLALLGPVVLVGSLNINDIVAWQARKQIREHYRLDLDTLPEEGLVWRPKGPWSVVIVKEEADARLYLRPTMWRSEMLRGTRALAALGRNHLGVHPATAAEQALAEGQLIELETSLGLEQAQVHIDGRLPQDYLYLEARDGYVGRRLTYKLLVPAGGEA